MNFKGRALWLLASSALWGAVASPAAHAQAAKPAAQPAAAALEEVVVTARRVEERLQDVPISITVYNQQQLTSRNIVSTTDLARYTPSLDVNSHFGPDKSSFVIRGFSQDLNTLPTVGVYFADAVAPRLNSNITSGNGAGVGSMFDLQNVQVLKGPQGTLFGRNTTGGAILLVPQKPTDRYEGYIEATGGTYGEKRVQAVVNIPVNDKIRIRAGIDHNERDGYLNNLSGIGPKDFNNINYTAGRLSVVLDLTPTLENYTILTYALSDTNGNVSKIAYCNRGTKPGSVGNTSIAAILRTGYCGQQDKEAAAGFGLFDVENTDPNPFVKNRTWQAINTTTWKATDTLTVKNIASYGIATEAYSFNLDGDNPTPPFAFPFVITNPGPREPQGKQWTLTEELQLQGHTSDDRFTYQVGGYMELSAPRDGEEGQEQYTQVWDNCTNLYAFQCTPLKLGPATLGSVSIARNVYSYHNYGIYAQGTFKITDQWSLTGGIRNTWDWQQENADNIQVVTSAAGPLIYRCSRAVTPPGSGAELLTNGVCGLGRTFKTSSHKPTWLIDLDYKPTQDILTYVKYARGYRGGGINEANTGAETWNPETLDDYEVGVKTTLRGPIQGTFNIDGFWDVFKDQQATVVIPQCVATTPGCTHPAPTGINGIQNIGQSRIRGIEADTSLLLTNDFRLDVGYSYLDAVVTGGAVPFCDNTRFNCAAAAFLTPGSVLPFAPKMRITTTATYTVPVSPDLGKITLAATFTHTTTEYTGHSNDLAFAQGVIPFNASINPDTNLLNLNVNWDNFKGYPVDLQFFATNATNQHYYVGTSQSLSTVGGELIVLGEPRMFGVRVRYHWGS
jgi:iron complex outermembrane receptor protein